MTIKDNGGPAFPITDFGVNTKVGMSLRDWFAGQALSAFAIQAPTGAQSAAACAYAFADAMIAERAKQ